MKPLVILAGRENRFINKTCEKNKRRRYFRGFDAGI